jgi:hypothetical protein
MLRCFAYGVSENLIMRKQKIKNSLGNKRGVSMIEKRRKRGF